MDTAVSWEELFDLRLMGESLTPVAFVVVYQDGISDNFPNGP